jgi:hypothetical protein
MSLSIFLNLRMNLEGFVSFNDPICDDWQAALDAIHHLSCIARERGHFQIFVKYLEGDVAEEDALICLKFIATLVNTAPVSYTINRTSLQSCIVCCFLLFVKRQKDNVVKC